MSMFPGADDLKQAMRSDPSKVAPLSDQEIRAATQELIRSTSLITRQTEALREQQQHLDRLVAEHKRDTQARAALEVQQLKGLGERQRELMQSVSFFFLCWSDVMSKNHDPSEILRVLNVF